MDIKFQDRIDEYLLHGDTMSEEDKAQLLKEIEEDAEKKEQYEFAKNVKKAVASRGEKLQAMADFQEEYEWQRARIVSCCAEAAPALSETETPVGQVEQKKPKRGKVWIWISGIAAVLAIGFFAINPLLTPDAPTYQMRGEEDDVFNPTAPTDSVGTDSISADTITLQHE